MYRAVARGLADTVIGRVELTEVSCVEDSLYLLISRTDTAKKIACGVCRTVIYKKYPKPCHLIYVTDTETPTRWKKLTICCPQACRPGG